MPRVSTPMIFNGIYLENFKAFGKQGAEIPLGKITLIYGKNSGGKSTVLKSLGSMAQTNALRTVSQIENDWLSTGPWFDLGRREQVVHKGFSNRKKTFKIGFDFVSTHVNAMWQKKIGEPNGPDAVWKKSDIEISPETESEQSVIWLCTLPAELPKRCSVSLTVGEESRIIHASDGRKQFDPEQLEKLNRDLESDPVESLKDVHIDGTKMVVRFHGPPSSPPLLEVHQILNIQNRLIYCYKYADLKSPMVKLVGIEYWEKRAGKMQKVCDGEVVKVPEWFDGTRPSAAEVKEKREFIPSTDALKLRFRNTDSLVWDGCQSNDDKIGRRAIYDNRMLLDICSGLGTKLVDESGEGGLAKKTISREVGMWEDDLMEQVVESAGKVEDWGIFREKLNNVIRRKLTNEIGLELSSAERSMLKRIIADESHHRNRWPSWVLQPWEYIGEKFTKAEKDVEEEPPYPDAWVRMNADVAELVEILEQELDMEHSKRLEQMDLGREPLKITKKMQEEIDIYVGWLERARILDKAKKDLTSPLLEMKDNRIEFGLGNLGFAFPGVYRRIVGAIMQTSGKVQALTNEIDYLSGARGVPQRYFRQSTASGQIGEMGKRSIANLANSFIGDEVAMKVLNEKLEDVVSMHVEFSQLQDKGHPTDFISVNVGRPKKPKKLQLPDVGYGVSQALPLIAATLTKQLLLVEEAESNLHPAAQANLMKVLMESIREGGVAGPSLILETHSEHFLKAALRHLEGVDGLTDEDVCILYVENDDEGSVVRRIETLDGEFKSPWPRDTWSDPTNPII